MKRFRRSVLVTLTCLICGALAPAAHAAGSLGLAKWEAGTCNGTETTVKECKYSGPHSDFYTQSAGHPPWGLTGFELANSGAAPNGSALKRLRVDVPPGLAADPVTLGTCSKSQFEANSCPAESKAGFVELKAYAEIPLLPQTLTLKGNVYNLPEEPGHPLMFGIDVEGIKPIIEDVHLLLEGHVSWGPEAALEARGVPSGDFHEWFEINNIPKTVKAEVEIPILGGFEIAEVGLKTVESKLFFDGHAGIKGKENFLTMPSSCSAPSTSYLELETYGPVERLNSPTTPPVSVEGCDKVPFQPTATIQPETSQYDTPDGITTDVHVPQKEKSSEINTADIADAHVTLPEGLTLNPSAAHGLEACTKAQLGKGTRNPVGCPLGSKIGEVTIETDLPPGALTGNVYLGRESAGPITKPPYLIFIDAESIYDVSVRLEGQAVPNPTTGRLEVSFLGNPQLPFSDLLLKLKGGPRAPLANGVTCGTATTNALFTPYTGASPFTPSTPFATTGCPSAVPFALAQSTSQTTTKAAAFTSFTFNLARNDGQQNLSSLQTTLPAGLVGLIPSIKRCPAAQALAGSCPSTSQIGTASATAGVGSEPFGFSGPVYLTEAINGAPYGLFVPIEAAAGPFDLGQVKTYVTLNVDPHSGSVIASATLPRIVGGVPLHLRGLSVAVTKPNFLFNPTYCGGLTTSSLLSAIQGATSTSSSALPVTSCSSLPFKPAFAAASPTAPSRANGASLTVSYTQPDHQANIRSVVASLPKELPSRLTTLHNACAEGIFASGNNYKACPAGSKVGSVTVTTPVLPEKLTGPAYLVSHGGAAFPNLDLILEGDHGVKVVIEGTTNIKGGITTSSFPTIPDVPVSGFELSLPTGPNSALGSFGSLCAKPLYMPTTITAQSGTVSKQNLHLSIGSCKIKLLSHKIKKKKLVVRVQVFTAGRVSVTSPGLHTVYRKVGGPGIVTIKVPISIKGKKTLASGRSLKVRARVGFNPKHKDEFHSAAFAKVTFRH
ncbi:MAG TPA: hypothetical protein VH061_16045 [Solirubrobacteraceae bacterium]|jgi:hypothetical protein|nr:hypothetical protein [Solirubrobacteraceae bacterium]